MKAATARATPAGYQYGDVISFTPEVTGKSVT